MSVSPHLMLHLLNLEAGLSLDEHQFSYGMGTMTIFIFLDVHLGVDICATGKYIESKTRS